MKVQCAQKSQDAVSPKGTDLPGLRDPETETEITGDGRAAGHRLEQGSFLG